MKIKEILVLHHSHLDVDYTHSQPVLWEMQREYLDLALGLLEETADWPEHSRPKWTCEVTAPVLKWLESASLANLDRLRAFVGQWRLAIDAMRYNITPLNTAAQLRHQLAPIFELRKRIVTLISAAAVAVTPVICANTALAESAAESAKPNIVFILADDLAYRDLSCFGQKNFSTPNIDKLAAEGCVFTNAYAGAAWCAPSRAALLTGRNGLHFAPLAKDAEGRGTKFNPTVAEALKPAGYTSCAIGKWHMCEGADSWLFGKTFDSNKDKVNWAQMPWHRGFDVSRIGYFYSYNPHYTDAIVSSDSEVRHFPENKFVDKDYLGHPPKPSQYNDQGLFVDSNGTDSSKLTYTEDVYREEAVNFIRSHKEKPFFLYYATPLVHSMLAAKSIADFKDRKGWTLTHKIYASMVQEIDKSVGAIVAELKSQGLDKNTIVIFTSDNGYASYTTNSGNTAEDDPLFQNKGPWNRGKFNMTNGGHIVPFIAWCPGRVPQGETARAINFCDFMATAAELGGAKLSCPTEGVSFVPLLEGREKDQPLRNAMIWPNKFPMLTIKGTDAAGTDGQVPDAVLLDEKWYAVVYKGQVRLFDIIADPGMKTNLAAQHPELCTRAIAAFL